MITINQLDPSQENVLESLLASDEEDKNLFVIYGPPGTGKSHLIVSLLFELAVRKKKILFVSQNTQALKVVDRMISKLETNLFDRFDSKNPDDKDNIISLRDFCLMFSQGNTKQKKWLKEQYNRIMTKEFPYYDKDDKEINDIPPYSLSYTNLQKILIMKLNPRNQ